MIRIRTAAVLAMALLGVWLGLAATAQASPSFVDGPVTLLQGDDCATGQLDPLAAQTFVSYQGSPVPAVGDIYYIGIRFQAGNGSKNSAGHCEATQNATLALALPPHTTLATATAPIACYVAGVQVSSAAGCPTSPPLGSGQTAGYYMLGTWSDVADGTTVEVDVPVITSTAMTNATNKSCTTNAQGCALGSADVSNGEFITPDPAGSTEGITVGASGSTTTGSLPSFGSITTGTITQTTASFSATDNADGQAGTLYANIGVASTQTGNQSVFADCTGTTYAVAASLAVPAGIYNYPVTITFTGLTAGTRYCWYESYVETAHPSPIVGPPGTQIFTAPATHLYLLPGVTGASTSDITLYSADATATFTNYGATGELITELEQVGAGGSCTGQTVVTGAAGTTITNTHSTQIDSLLTGLQPGTNYCWRFHFLPDNPSVIAITSAWVPFTTAIMLFRIPISYPSPATTNIGQSSATGTATVNDGSTAGSTYAQLGTAVSGSCSAPAGVLSLTPTSLAPSGRGFTETNQFQSLAAATMYCWRQVYLPAGGSVFDGAWQSFTTQSPGFQLIVPGNTIPPTISGTLEPGQTLTATPGSWTDRPFGYDYQWERCDATGGSCTAITGATGSTYTLVAQDIGRTIRVVVRPRTALVAGLTTSATSAATAAVIAAPTTPTKPANAGAPTIAGSPAVGSALTATPGTWTGTTPITFTYRWQRCATTCTDIAGATGASYTPASADAGSGLDLIVTATNSAGEGVAVSEPVGPVGPNAGLLTELLKHVVAPSGKGARIAALLKHRGYRLAFTAPAAGRLAIAWYVLPSRAHRAKVTAKPTLIAAAAASYAAGVLRHVEVTLTAPGRRLLRHARTARLSLTAIGSFTVPGSSPVSVTKAIALRR